MSHEENKNDSQFYYPAINTIFYVNAYFRSPCTHSTNIYRVLLCARHWRILDAEDGIVSLSKQHTARLERGARRAWCGRQAPNKIRQAVYSFPRTSCNKVPRSRWPKTTEMYCVTVLEAGSLKSRCQQGWFLPREAVRWPSPGFW